MKCKRCGNTVLPNQVFCNKCGAPVVEEDKKKFSLFDDDYEEDKKKKSAFYNNYFDNSCNYNYSTYNFIDYKWKK